MLKPRIEIFRAIAFFALFGLTACSKPSASQDDDAPEPASVGTVNAQKVAGNSTVPASASFNSYCYKRIGQIQAQPRRGEKCDVHGGGAGGGKMGPDVPIRNTVTLHISSPSLKATGIKTFTFTINRGDAAPKFTTGVHVMDQVQLAGRNPTQGEQLPDRMAFVADATGEHTMFSWSSPDAAYLKGRAPDFDFPGFEISDATLIIDKVVDVPMDDFKIDFARQAGMVIGEQYVEGTLKITLIPMGSKGEMYGPATFEFGVPIDWGYSK